MHTITNRPALAYPCLCYVTETVWGETLCSRCRGDWWACECPTHHSRHCPHNVPWTPAFAALDLAEAIGARIEATVYEQCVGYYVDAVSEGAPGVDAWRSVQTLNRAALADIALWMKDYGIRWSVGHDYPEIAVLDDEPPF
jgi:hypothetical protein